MKTLIVVNSHKGNTRRIAEAIADQLKRHGSAEVVDVDAAASAVRDDIDLLLVGGPTEGHGMTPEMRGYLDGLAASSVRGRAVAAFDTRLGWPRILSGSAGDGIAARLARLDAQVIGPVGSFIVTSTPSLEPGEIERAREWAESIAARAVPVAA
ncbi:MAG TPA: flavodoxin family protein [Candidatus Limnocylindrales bacterium]|jgi:flavodoxin